LRNRSGERPATKESRVICPAFLFFVGGDSCYASANIKALETL